MPPGKWLKLHLVSIESFLDILGSGRAAIALAFPQEISVLDWQRFEAVGALNVGVGKVLIRIVRVVQVGGQGRLQLLIEVAVVHISVGSVELGAGVVHVRTALVQVFGLVKDQLILLFDYVKQVFTFAGADDSFESLGVDETGSVICDLIGTFVVLAGRYKCTLRTTLLNEKFTLQAYGCMLQLFESLLLQNFPDLFLVHVGPLLDELLLVRVQTEIHLWT